MTGNLVCFRHKFWLWNYGISFWDAADCCHKFWFGTLVWDLCHKFWCWNHCHIFFGVTNFDLIFQGTPGIGHKSAGHRRAKRKEADQPEVGLAPVARIQGGVPD